MAKQIKKTETKSSPISRRQKFSLKASEAKSVALVGDFTNWNEQPVNLKLKPNGNWSINILLKPGEYHYRFIVDGNWCDDPDCHVKVSNPYGSENCVVCVTPATSRKRKN